MAIDDSLLLFPFTGGDFRVAGIRPLGIAGALFRQSAC